MLKKILIGLGVILLIVVGFMAYKVLTTKSHSPQDIAEISSGDLSIKVVYCQPYKKDRVIFAEEGDDVLVPYGKYWRLGANDATEITFSQDVSFAGEHISAGSYRMYAVPSNDSWEVSLNSQLGEWGYYEPDYKLDVAKVRTTVQTTSEEIEQFTIRLDSDSTGIQMNMMWDKTLVSVPISQ